MECTPKWLLPFLPAPLLPPALPSHLSVCLSLSVSSSPSLSLSVSGLALAEMPLSVSFVRPACAWKAVSAGEWAPLCPRPAPGHAGLFLGLRLQAH